MTHWAHAAELARRFTAVRVDPRVLYVDEGDILTSAGMAAGIDLCLHIVRCDWGAEVANVIARNMVVAPHRDGGQAQFIAHPVPTRPESGLEPTRLWALERLDEPLTIPHLATYANMSVRHFVRRFREETGVSPLRWLHAQRVMRAQHLLETTELSITRVAERSGLGSAESLRAHFHRVVGTAPLAYRRTFRNR
jgi:AraC family transcriptional regulator, transcriptional activator FtrA